MALVTRLDVVPATGSADGSFAVSAYIYAWETYGDLSFPFFRWYADILLSGTATAEITDFIIGPAGSGSESVGISNTNADVVDGSQVSGFGLFTDTTGTPPH